MSVFNQLKNIFRNNEKSEEKVHKLETVSRIVQEDTIAKSRLPEYEGLEDYTLIKKLGERLFNCI
ncbi:Putative CAMK/CAMK1/CAMK1-RCK protein kinase [Rhizopus microsporus]|nr:Putative CAMK/CAMK1/CAMK1-RCK protein kinase [Rhizopus microsporus]